MIFVQHEDDPLLIFAREFCANWRVFETEGKVLSIANFLGPSKRNSCQKSSLSDVMYNEGLLAVRAKLKGGKMRYVPMLPEFTDELRRFMPKPANKVHYIAGSNHDGSFLRKTALRASDSA